MRTKSSGIFVTGTDTGVGKTLISGAIARALVGQGIDCGVMKPIESGCRPGKNGLVPGDGVYLQKAAKLQAQLDFITPCRFKAPLSPYAAVLQGETDSLSWPLMDNVYRQLRQQHSTMLIEGAGGLMVPISADKDMADLIRLFNIPVLLVARSGLGTLNHCLLSLEYGKARGLSFFGIVLNQSASKRDASEESNAKVLHEKTALPVMRFPYLKPGKDDEATISASAIQMTSHPFMSVILRAMGQSELQ